MVYVASWLWKNWLSVIKILLIIKLRLAHLI
nr:MAG TPA: hypothetical protein [Caudoviricetes sp.]